VAGGATLIDSSTKRGFLFFRSSWKRFQKGKEISGVFIAFFNPQGNFDPHDSYWTMHPDFGGQLVYVKEVALRLAAMGHRVDIVTRQVLDPSWPEFAAPFDVYPGHDGVRIVRLPCGGDRFIRKEELWPVLGPEWVPAILDFYRAEGRFPDVVTGHYADGGLAAALFQEDTGVPFTFTAHSLGAQKMDRLEANARTLEALDARYHFARRIAAERVAMNHAAAVISSSCLERDEQYGHPAYRGAIDPADGKMVVIPPGVNLAVFDKDATKGGCRAGSCGGHVGQGYYPRAPHVAGGDFLQPS